MNIFFRLLKRFVGRIFVVQVDPWTAQVSGKRVAFICLIFTLTVVGIIFLLSYHPFEKQAAISADKKRISDLEELKSALISYQKDTGQLPQVSQGVRFLLGGKDSPQQPVNSWLGVNLSNYLSEVPIDPKFLSNSTAPYSYRYTTDGFTFKLDAFLEANAGNLMQQDAGILNDKGIPLTNRARYEVGTNLLLKF